MASVVCAMSPHKAPTARFGGASGKRPLSPKTTTVEPGFSRAKAARSFVDRKALFQTRCGPPQSLAARVSRTIAANHTARGDINVPQMPTTMVQVPVKRPIVEAWCPEEPSATTTTAFPSVPRPALSLNQYDSLDVDDPTTLSKLKKVFPFARNLQDRFEVGQELGRGSFGSVRLCRSKDGNKQLLAVKSLPKMPPKAARSAKGPTQLSTYLSKLEAEVYTMELLRGERMAVRHKDCFEDDTHLHVVMELCRGGSLQRRLNVEGALNEREAALTVFSVLRFLEGCHSRGIVYRDIKPENFMYVHAQSAEAVKKLSFHKAHAVKAVDFGQAILLDSECAVINRRSGTPAYMAPEVIKQCYGAKADMWCTGMLLYQLLSNRLPFWANVHDHDLKSVWTSILHSEVDFQDNLWEGISDDAKEVITMLLQKEPKLRPSAGALQKHPWFQKTLGQDVLDQILADALPQAHSALEPVSAASRHTAAAAC